MGETIHHDPCKPNGRFRRRSDALDEDAELTGRGASIGADWTPFRP